MGSNRAGWYAYEVIDNGGHRSAERILPDYQNIRVGEYVSRPARSQRCVRRCAVRARTQPLSWRLLNGQYQTTWAFILESEQPDQTRLIVRGRVASGYRPYGLPEWLALRVGRLAHFVMQRKQLLGIARRAEANDHR
jgi:hypothetical protein